jgi:hypothetical protein
MNELRYRYGLLGLRKRGKSKRTDERVENTMKYMCRVKRGYLVLVYSV